MNWTRVTSAATWPARYSHTSVVYDGKIWVIGGYDYTVQSWFDDVWSSSDGVTWVEATGTAEWPARNGHTSLAYDGKIWVIGGYDGSTFRNDVWSSPDGAT